MMSDEGANAIPTFMVHHFAFIIHHDYYPRMDSVHPQLALIIEELDAATAEARRLTDALDEARFQQRPAAGSWSIAECLAHLNLTTLAYLPLIDGALKNSSGPSKPATYRYRRDLMGWLLCHAPRRVKVKTTAQFVPTSTQSKQKILAEFATLQSELAQRVADASGHDLGRLKLASPFDARMKYNLYSCLKILPWHQRRHLWQADNVLAQI